MAWPEILAPAGSREALEAALRAGAEAVYFGLDEGFNARARAANFPLDQLGEVVDTIHRAGARAYLALNVLVLESELASLERILAATAKAGVDALIVQDPAVCWLSQQICPEQVLHASTQMTLSSPESLKLARPWGISRVVLPRELSLDEITKVVQSQPDVELEVFIAGALCMSWSGQCLSSEAWGGRSANRGQCAQACRHEYDLVVDGEARDLGNQAYLLSPHDLGGFDFIPQLAELGIHTLKIEGRQKDADYVYQAVKAVQAARQQQLSPERLRKLEIAYSRGLGPGFFGGSDHQSLVEGSLPRHRGVFLGKVERLHGQHVWLDRPFDLKAGMGVVFRRPAQRVIQDHEQGGPVFEVLERRLSFGRPGPDLSRVEVGDEVYLTGSPELAKERQGQPTPARWPLTLKLAGQAGQPLRACLEWEHGQVQAESEQVLALAQKRGLSDELLNEKLGAWGQSSFRLEHLLREELPEELFLPPSQLKDLRQRLQLQLESQLQGLGRKRVAAPGQRPARPTPLPERVLLDCVCRTPEQLEAVIEAGLPGVTLDWMELVGLKGAVERARQAGLRVGLATLRVQKPGEEVYDRRLLALEPDWLLARHWGAVATPSRVPVHGDFSLNVTNSITAALLIERGLVSVTAAHDLDAQQLEALVRAFEPSRLAVTVHHHIPTFHTEHCVYSHLLSQGRDYRSCGRPCEKHQVALRDRKGIEHPVVVDVGCRNTIFNGQAQSCLRLLPQMMDWGIGRLRLEFVRESQAETLTVIRAYQGVLSGQLDVAEARARIGGHEQFGLSLGTMAVLQG